MEKIKVNMTPCEEVKTIHASQGDNATRKWSFDLYDENGKIDSSSIKEQMIFDSRVGGTEQILPENTSNPTTSPIIADIQYPDSFRSEQIFLYRESPTSEDGQAKITHIKGNTLVWNQLVRVVTGTQALSNLSVSTNSDGTITVSGTANATGTFWLSDTLVNAGRYDNDTIYVKAQVLSGNIPDIILFGNGNYAMTNSERAKIVSNQPTYNNLVGFRLTDTTVYNFSVKVEAINLTKLGLPNLTIDQFTSLYPLPYYSYTQGKLLPFKGEELKTTGKNLLEIPTYSTTWAGLTIASNKDDGIIIKGIATASGSITEAGNYVKLIKGKTYTISGISGGSVSTFYIQATNEELTQQLFVITNGSYQYTPTQDETIFLRVRVISGAVIDTSIKTQCEFGSSASSYEPYTSSTINLPTLTYFSSGMKSAGSVYDEITESKAITRVGSVDLGTLTWNVTSTSVTGANRFQTDKFVIDCKAPASDYVKANIVCNKYPTIQSAETYTCVQGVSFSAGSRIAIYDDALKTYSASDFKTAMSGQYLYFELATPTEESITTASLVTEKGESPLYYDDELIADCNENISSESGIFDAKIKLMDDETIYSQKIQLHVERKP